MPENEPTHRHTFIVRFWQEETTLEWRGSVEHVTTGERHFFRSFEQLCEFLQEQMDIPVMSILSVKEL